MKQTLLMAPYLAMAGLMLFTGTRFIAEGNMWYTPFCLLLAIAVIAQGARLHAFSEEDTAKKLWCGIVSSGVLACAAVAAVVGTVVLALSLPQSLVLYALPFFPLPCVAAVVYGVKCWRDYRRLRTLLVH